MEKQQEILRRNLIPNYDKTPYVIHLGDKKLPEDINKQIIGQMCTDVWITKNYGQPWTVVQMDDTNFLEGCWSVSKDQMVKKRFGIAYDKLDQNGRNDLAGIADKFKVALNTLAFIDYNPMTTNLNAVDALVSLSDVTVLVSSVPSNKIIRRHRVITLAP